MYMYRKCSKTLQVAVKFLLVAEFLHKVRLEQFTTSVITVTTLTSKAPAEELSLDFHAVPLLSVLAVIKKCSVC